MLFSRPLAGALAVAALTTAAPAAVNVVESFSPVGPGLVENPRVNGSAVINFDEATFQTTVVMFVVRLRPGVTYGVKVDSAGAGFAVAEAFTAQTFLGIGLYSATFPGDASIATVIDVFKWDGDPDPFSIFEVTPDEERARGFGVY